MQGKEAVVFRGDRRGLSLQIDQEAAFADVLEELQRKLASATDFFRGAEVRIESGRRFTDEEEARRLHEVIEAHGLTLAAEGREQQASPEAAASSRGEPGRGKALSRNRAAGARHGATAPGGGPEPCLLVERTLRSGQRIEFDGSVVVLGDVNPGADVVASGSVVVMGALRGMVHAGARGDAGARVVALRLLPTQLRIAHYITRPPDGETPEASGPEEARIVGEHIQIERYEP